jgi:alanine racemase
MLGRRAAPAQAAAVVKADAYGLGALQVGAALMKAGCRRFYVAWPQEGAKLRALAPVAGQGIEIAVFHGPSADNIDTFAKYDLQPVLNSLEQVRLWRDKGEPRRPVALHVDTGMNRLGVHERDWAEAKRLLPEPAWLVSHLASPDMPDYASNERQLAGFQRAVAMWPKAKTSFSSTAGVYLGSRYHFDEIRPGIGLYGGGPVPRDGDGPQPVVTLTAPVLQVRSISPGEEVGYGGTSKAGAEGVIAALGIGYADGFLRSASSRGYGFIGGEKRQIVGRVSMDLTMIDVTGLDVAVGDEVEMLGPHMPIAEQAEAMGTIDYEILTRLGSRIARSYVGGG